MSAEPQSVDRDPYLPPPVPTDNPPAKPEANPKATFFVWLALIAIFVALVVLFSDGPSRHGTAASSGISPWSFVVPGIFVLLIVVFWRQLRVSRGFNEGVNAAMLALADGDLEQARRHFAELVEKNRGNQHVHNARVNLAWTLQRMGRFDEEREVLLALERTPGLLFASEHRLYAAAYLARHFALSGDLERAQAWLEDAQRRRDRIGHVALFLLAQLRIIEALLLARRDQHAQALAILEKDWPRLEAALTTVVLKHVLVLRAYLIAGAGGVRDQGLSAQWVAKVRPFRTDEIAYLWEGWPALRQWAEANQLARAPAQADAG
jgi:hypothetical protein